MSKSLKDYANEKGISYSKAWREFQSDKLNGAYKADDGRIYVEGQKQKTATAKNNLDLEEVYGSNDSTTRRNRVSTRLIGDRYDHIREGIHPFRHKSLYSNDNDVDIHDAILLTQKAYYNFAPLRNVIELMTEFAISEIFFRGGSKSSRRFFEAFFKKINLFALQEQFYRELFRSGNVFIFRFNGTFQREDLRKITQVFGLEAISKEVNVPLRYTILNPADIQFSGGVDFSSGKFEKELTDYELERLRSPKTEEDQQVFNNLPAEVRRQIQNPQNKKVKIPLEPEQVYAVFFQKQPYEPMAVPMPFPVLHDINFKQEMKKMDQAAQRSINYWVLLVTMGDETNGVNQKNLQAMKSLFDNEAIGKVLVSDWTTTAQFVTPDLSDFLDPRKYEVVERDINMGLNNILVGSERFANQSIKVKVFIERLKKAQEMFKNKFLIPEIRKIAKTMGFKNFPEPHFDDIQFRDEGALQRIHSRLLELGILTPEEGFDALEKGRLPSKEESLENQEDYIEERRKGFYTPLVGGNTAFVEKAATKNKSGNNGEDDGNRENSPTENGRPPDTGRPKDTDTKNPMQAKFIMSSFKDNVLKADKLYKKVEESIKKKHKISELNDKQKAVVDQLTNMIVANRAPNKWLNSVQSFIKNPRNDNEERLKQIDQIAATYQTDQYVASLLVDCQTNAE